MKYETEMKETIYQHYKAELISQFGADLSNFIIRAQKTTLSNFKKSAAHHKDEVNFINRWCSGLTKMEFNKRLLQELQLDDNLKFKTEKINAIDEMLNNYHNSITDLRSKFLSSLSANYTNQDEINKFIEVNRQTLLTLENVSNLFEAEKIKYYKLSNDFYNEFGHSWVKGNK